jgi:uncharacterized protein YoxC
MINRTTTSGDNKDPAANEPDKAKSAKTSSDNGAFEGDAMDRFARSFEASARRWEIVIYPTMLAFVILAAYGFFLIYTLSRDIHSLAQGMDPEMGKNLTHISDSVAYLSENIRTMTRRIDKMTNSIDEISGKMDSLETLPPMLVNMRGMNDSMRSLNVTTDLMRQDMSYMSRNVSRPLEKLNNFMPW